MSDVIVIDAEVLPTPLPDELQGVARRYVAARQGANEKTLEASAALYEARQIAVHGEWYTFLEATNTSQDLADRLLDIYAEAQRSPTFRDSVVRGWLPQTQAALVARSSTPPEAKAQVVAQAAAAGAAVQAPPTKREVERTIQTAKNGGGADSKSRTGAGSAQAPSRPVELIPMSTTAPTGAPTVLASVPATSTTLPPMLNLGGAASASMPPVLVIGAPATPAAPAAPAVPTGDPVWIAEATVSLLEQTLNLAEVHRDRMRFEEAATTPVEIDDNAIDRAARALLSSPVMTNVVDLVVRLTGLDRSDPRINGWLKECGL